MVAKLYHRSWHQQQPFSSEKVYWAAVQPASPIYGDKLYEVEVYLPVTGEEDYLFSWDIDNLEPEWLWGRDANGQFCFRGGFVVSSKLVA